MNLRTRIVIAASAALVLLSPTLAAQERLTLGACIDATLSRACLDLNNKERKRHFFAALWLLQQGLVVPDNFTGSWAGASGLTQFMPATFVAHMESASGAGPVDIVGSLPDALATTANYIASLGWTQGMRWGVEVALPKGALRDLVRRTDQAASTASSFNPMTRAGSERHTSSQQPSARDYRPELATRTSAQARRARYRSLLPAFISAMGFSIAADTASATMPSTSA